MLSHESNGLAEPRRPRLGRMVNPCDNSCSQVQAIQTMWYPELKAPNLPLEGCQNGQSCSCAWRFVRDRRVLDRRSISDGRGELRFGANSARRTQRDRRRDALMGYNGAAQLS